jgi:hypothetical protein
MLGQCGAASADIAAVQQALRALYDDSLPCTGACRIVQDADRLAKLGAMGVAAFFTKATLRGHGLTDSLVQSLSRELTYAQAAPRSMLTDSGRTLARGHSARTIAFFDDLLGELEGCGLGSFQRRPLVVEGNFRTRDGAHAARMEVSLVTPVACPDCEAPIGVTHRCERGLKCETLKARLACSACAYAREISFCLPVFA